MRTFTFRKSIYSLNEETTQNKSDRIAKLLNDGTEINTEFPRYQFTISTKNAK
jgi:hypothetical protein